MKLEILHIFQNGFGGEINDIKKDSDNLGFKLGCGKVSLDFKFGKHEDKILLLKHLLTHCLLTHETPSFSVYINYNDDVFEGNYAYLEKNGAGNFLDVSFSGKRDFTIRFHWKDSVEFEKFFEKIF